MSSTSRTILLVDDDDSHRLLAKRALRDLGVQFLEARSAEEAEKALVDHGPQLSLIILDMNLAGVSGLSILKTVRTRYSFEQLITVVLSTSALEGDIREAYEAGANCYLVKSIDPSEFRATLRKAAHFFLPSSS